MVDAEEDRPARGTRPALADRHLAEEEPDPEARQEPQRRRRERPAGSACWLMAGASVPRGQRGGCPRRAARSRVRGRAASLGGALPEQIHVRVAQQLARRARARARSGSRAPRRPAPGRACPSRARRRRRARPPPPGSSPGACSRGRPARRGRSGGTRRPATPIATLTRPSRHGRPNVSATITADLDARARRARGPRMPAPRRRDPRGGGSPSRGPRWTGPRPALAQIRPWRVSVIRTPAVHPHDRGATRGG